MESKPTHSILAEKLTLIKRDILKDVDIQLTSAIDNLLMTVERNSTVDGSVPKVQPLEATKTKSEDKEAKQTLPDKIFILRNSPLTDLWAVPHIHAVYNICTAMFIVLIILSILFYFFDNTNKLVDDLQLLFWAGGKVYSWLSIWMGMKFSCILIFYPVYALWASSRKPVQRIGSYDILFFVILLTYLLAFLFIPVKLMLITDLPPVSSTIVLMEQTRMLMKIYAFVRENVPKTLKFKPHQDGDDFPTSAYPEFQKFLYFLFIPTLVYRDIYPRTMKVRWEYVFWNFLQMFAATVTAFITFQRFVIPIFKDVGHHYFTPVNFIVVYAGSVLEGTLTMFLGFYGILHCWMNAFAEMLRYGDRLFYEDWWNSRTYSQFYRRWNRIVHDWIYAYPYRDLLWLFGKYQTGALIFVVFISAVIHEFIIGFTFRFLCPVMLIQYFVFGTAMQLITRKQTSAGWNVFLWMSLFMGWGILITFYSTEWYARKNCPVNDDSSSIDVTPRFWSCSILYLVGD